jgi:thiol-disulfide isomerase/thioredoxin
LATVLLALFCASLCLSPGEARLALAPGDKAPHLRGDTVTGKRKVINFTAKSYTVLNFWATWCEPCKDEMPALQKLHREHAEDGLQVIGVIYDWAKDPEVAQFLESVGVTYTVIRTPEWVTHQWGGVGSLPTTYLIDGDGVIRRRYVGATEPEIEGMIADVRDVLAGRALGPQVLSEETRAVTSKDAPKPPSR